jgi:hypothetical protein
LRECHNYNCPCAPKDFHPFSHQSLLIDVSSLLFCNNSSNNNKTTTATTTTATAAAATAATSINLLLRHEEKFQAGVTYSHRQECTGEKDCS